MSSLPLARKLLESSNEFVRAAGGASGVFRLAWTDYASYLLHRDFLLAASRANPGLSFEFFTHSSMDVLDRLQEGRIDIGIPVPVPALQFHAQYRRNARASLCDALCDTIRDLAAAALATSAAETAS